MEISSNVSNTSNAVSNYSFQSRISLLSKGKFATLYHHGNPALKAPSFESSPKLMYSGRY